jgi:pyrroline-5-carboxylate reductase
MIEFYLMENSKITFIGGGNMALSLIGGLVSGNCPGGNISVSDPDSERLKLLQDQFGVKTFVADNCNAVVDADIVLLAVKPQQLAAVATEIASSLTNKSLLISIAAGVREPDLQRWLGGGHAIVRTMPNTPSLLQSGATALYANSEVTENQRNLAESIMRAVGVTAWLDDESQLDAVTAISGSGPAYFFLLMEAMERTGVELGLSAESARLLTLQTAFGAAKMALELPKSSSELRQQVTSPGGTTEQAILTFQQGEFENLVKDAVSAAHKRSIELGDILGDQSLEGAP